MKLLKELGNRFNKFYDSVTDADSGWSRTYDFYLIFGQINEGKSPWITADWKSDFEPYFDSLLKQTENIKETGIRAIKYKLENRVSKNNEEFIYHSEMKLGRLTWDEKSHEKWTMTDNTSNYFQDFELWKPIWTVCDKKQSAPDLYIKITNEKDFENKRDVKFDYLIVAAIGKNLKIDSKSIIKELSGKINAKAAILKTRKWNQAQKEGNWTFRNGIQDTFSSGIYNEKDIHSFDFDKLEFDPSWEVIYQEK